MKGRKKDRMLNGMPVRFISGRNTDGKSGDLETTTLDLVLRNGRTYTKLEEMEAKLKKAHEMGLYDAWRGSFGCFERIIGRWAGKGQSWRV